MKKFLIGLLISIICVPIALGIVLGVAYSSVEEESIPQITISVMNQTITPNGYEWHIPVFGGILYRDFARSPSLEAHNLGTISEQAIPIVFPTDLSCQLILSKDGVENWKGSPEEWANHPLSVNGSYTLDILCEKAQTTKTKPYGKFSFRLGFELQLEPLLETSETNVKQGDVLAVRLSNLQGGVVPTIQVDIPNITQFGFVPTGEGQMTAFVPVSFYCEAGEYTVHIQAGDFSWDIPLTAIWVEFPKQEMEIDTTDPAISAATTQEAYTQFNDAVLPLYEINDAEMLWEGLFRKPADAYISTDYGSRRFTNGSPTSRPHNGMDIAADEGDPVIAPASGRVVLAEFLLATGWTIVIEHGGGLKTFYYHMVGLHVEKGAMVSAGDLIGDVGTTGYSTGPHLHFEVRVGNQPIDPALVLSGNSNLYYFL